MYLIKKSAGPSVNWEGIRRGVYHALGTYEKCGRPSTHELGLTIVTNEYCDEHYKAPGES